MGFHGVLYDFYMIWGMKQVQYLPRTNLDFTKYVNINIGSQ